MAARHAKNTPSLAEAPDDRLAPPSGPVKVKPLNPDESAIGDSGLPMEHLTCLTEISCLDLSFNDVNDLGLVHLKGLIKLSNLDLSSSLVTGAGIIHLTGLTNLAQLHLIRTRVDDDGLIHFRGLKNLSELSLGWTRTSDAGLVHLNAFSTSLSYACIKLGSPTPDWSI